MNTTKTTPEPLTVGVDETNRAKWTLLRSVGHQPNAEQAGVGHSIAIARCYDAAEAIRLAHAYNACAGMADPAAEIAALRATLDNTTAQVGELMRQRDALREVLKTIAAWVPSAAPSEPGGMSIIDAIDIARAALGGAK